MGRVAARFFSRGQRFNEGVSAGTLRSLSVLDLLRHSGPPPPKELAPSPGADVRGERPGVFANVDQGNQRRHDKGGDIFRLIEVFL